jgi:hypothetical protein
LNSTHVCALICIVFFNLNQNDAAPFTELSANGAIFISPTAFIPFSIKIIYYRTYNSHSGSVTQLTVTFATSIDLNLLLPSSCALMKKKVFNRLSLNRRTENPPAWKIKFQRIFFSSV